MARFKSGDVVVLKYPNKYWTDNNAKDLHGQIGVIFSQEEDNYRVEHLGPCSKVVNFFYIHESEMEKIGEF